MDVVKKLAAALRQNGDLTAIDLRHNQLSDDSLRVLRSAAAARPRSIGGDLEPLEIHFEPQAPLPANKLAEPVSSSARHTSRRSHRHLSPNGGDPRRSVELSPMQHSTRSSAELSGKAVNTRKSFGFFGRASKGQRV